MWQGTSQLCFEMMLLGTSHGMLGTVLIVAISLLSYDAPSRLLGHDGKLSSSSSSSFCSVRRRTHNNYDGSGEAGDEMMLILMIVINEV
jgi:hypothetical protein